MRFKCRVPHALHTQLINLHFCNTHQINKLRTLSENENTTLKLQASTSYQTYHTNVDKPCFENIISYLQWIEKSILFEASVTKLLVKSLSIFKCMVTRWSYSLEQFQNGILLIKMCSFHRTAWNEVGCCIYESNIY